MKRQPSAEKIGHEIIKIGQASRTLLLKGAVMFCAMLMSRAAVFGTLSPFGAAFVAAAPHGYAAVAAIGALLGCIMPGGVQEGLRAAATIIATAGIRWALGELKKVSNHPAFRPLAAFAATVLTGAVVSSAIGAVISYDLLLYVSEGLVSGAAAFFLHRAFECLRCRRLYAIEREERTAVVIAACILGIGICSFEIGGFAPGYVVLILLMLCAAKEKQEIGGAVGGIAAGCVVALSGGGYVLAGITALVGLLAGVFAHLGTWAVAISACVTASLCMLGTASFNFIFIAQVLLAAVMFKLIPDRFYITFCSALGLRREVCEGSVLASCEVGQRLENAAAALRGVSDTVEAVSGRLDRRQDEFGIVCRQVSARVCEGCALSGACWGENAAQTSAAFEEVEPVLRSRGAVRSVSLPEHLAKRCAKSTELAECFNEQWADFAAREGARRRIAQVRSVISDQLGGVSTMLDDLAQQTRDEETLDNESALIVAEAIKTAGYVVSNVRCIRSPAGRLDIRAQVEGRRNRALPRSELIFELEAVLDTPLATPVYTGGAEFVMETHSLPQYAVEFGIAQHCCDGERLCGDSYDAFLTQDGCAVMILSDGMGSGGRAAVDSAMASGLMGRLLEAGFGFDGALKVVNSSLLVKSDDESLATLDVMSINTYDGSAQLCKAGAVPTFVRTGEGISTIAPQSLPLGILRQIDSSCQSLELEDGDTVVMISDGVSNESGWLEDMLERYHESPAPDLAQDILAQALLEREEGAEDDMTVMVAHIKENN